VHHSDHHGVTPWSFLPLLTGPTPAGYFVVPVQGYRIAFAFRSIKRPGMSDADANAYAKTLKLYPLAEAADPKPTRFVDGIDQRISTLPYYDDRYFADLHAILSVEPVRTRDKVMMGMLASIGFEPGKPFDPSPKLKKLLTRAVVDAYFYMQDRFDKVQMKNLYWPDRHWSYFFLPDSSGSVSWDTDTALLYDNRSDMYHPGTFYPKKILARMPTVYLAGLADTQGRLLEGGKTYRLRVPKDIPVTQFWSLIVNDLATWAFIYNPLDRVGLSSYDKTTMKVNADVSVDLYFGPKAPKGWESNWIPTQGKRPVPVMRLYGPEDAFWDKSFKMPDLELVR
jgi:hypothetical protein